MRRTAHGSAALFLMLLANGGGAGSSSSHVAAAAVVASSFRLRGSQEQRPKQHRGLESWADEKPLAPPPINLPTAAPSQLPRVNEVPSTGKLIEDQPPAVPPPQDPPAVGNSGSSSKLIEEAPPAVPPPVDPAASQGAGKLIEKQPPAVSPPVTTPGAGSGRRGLVPATALAGQYQPPNAGGQPSGGRGGGGEGSASPFVTQPFNVDPRTGIHPGVVGPAGTGDAGNFRRGRRQLQSLEEWVEEGAPRIALEGKDSSSSRAAFIQGLVGAWDPDRRDGAVEQGQQQLRPKEEEELAAEIKEEEGVQMQLPASEAAAARDGWFGGLPVPGEEGDPDAEEDGPGMKRPKVAATAIAGQWKPQHVIPAPQTSVNVEGEMEVGLTDQDAGRGGQGQEGSQEGGAEKPESDNGLRASPASDEDEDDLEAARARMVAKAREIKTSPSETQAVWDPAAFMAAAFRGGNAVAPGGVDSYQEAERAVVPGMAYTASSPSETRADVGGLRRRRREEDAEEDMEEDMEEARDVVMAGLLDSSPSETRAVNVFEAEVAAMRAQAREVDSSPSETKAVPVEAAQPAVNGVEPPLELLVASSPSETAAVPAAEAASPLLFFQEGDAAAAAAAAAGESVKEEEQQEGPDPSDVVSNWLLMNGDGF